MSGETIHYITIADWKDALLARAAVRDFTRLFASTERQAALTASAVYDLIGRLRLYSENISLNIDAELENRPQYIQVFLHGFDVHIPLVDMEQNIVAAVGYRSTLKEAGCELSALEKPGFGTVVALTIPAADGSKIVLRSDIKEVLPVESKSADLVAGEVEFLNAAFLDAAVLSPEENRDQPSRQPASPITPPSNGVSRGGLEFIQEELRETRRNLKASVERYDALVDLKVSLQSQLDSLRNRLSGKTEGDAGSPPILHVADIKEAVKQVASISAQLQSHFQSTGEAPVFDISIDRFSVQNVFDALHTVFGDSAQHKNLALRFELDPQVPELNTDKSRMIRILHHLVDNAVKYTEKGTIRVAAAKASHKGEVVFTVEDTGIGISPDHHRNIFGEGIARERQGASHFSGLPITKDLVKSLRGKIAVDSQVGHGSKFTIILPVDFNAETGSGDEELPLGTASDPAPVAEATADKDTAILVVEDDEATQFLMKKILSAEYLCFGASSANEAFAVLGKNNIRFIYMDIALRGSVDGIELTRQLRSSEEWKDIPIIALTSFTHDMTRGEALCAGCDDYLTKPINKAEVLGKVKEFVRPYKAQDLAFLK